MQQGQGRRESLAEPRHQLRREADFRHQHQRAPTAPQDAFHRVQIDLGLAAAGDAIQNKGCESRVRRIDGFDGRRLLGAQWRP
jgi:hypothetical protein